MRKTSLRSTGRRWIARAVIAGAVAGAGLAYGPAATASAYVGADLVQLNSDLNWNDGSPTEKYTTSHLRLKAGVDVLPWLAMEGQILTSGDDTYTNDVWDTYVQDTGAIFGIFAKPHITIGTADFYGLVGFATADATNDCVNFYCAPGWSATLNGPAYGVGVQFYMSRNLRLAADYMVYFDDTATYSGFGTYRVDQQTRGFGIGFNAAF